MARSNPTPRGLKVSTEESLALRIPSISLPPYGKVVDIETSEIIPFNPEQATYKLQQTLVGYFSEESLIEGRDLTYWLTVLKGRQTGSTTACTMCLYPLVSYTPGVSAAIIADKQARANDMFKRLNLAYNHWPKNIRTDRESTNESKCLTTSIDSKVNVLSAESPDVGIGLSVDYLVGSECPLWANASEQMSSLLPAMIKRKASKVVMESTPQPLSAPSGEWWRDHWFDSKRGKGRWRAAFFPFWDAKANRAPWPKGSAITLEEQRLLDAYGKPDPYGHPGLTLENLAFRRFYMDSDSEVRRNPELFKVWFPFDDLTCWISQGVGVIPNHALDRHVRPGLAREDDEYVEFEPPHPDGIYVIGCDPAGTGRDNAGNDHCSFQVLRIWDDEWRQVAVFGGDADTLRFCHKLDAVGRRYNNALLGVERNGVGHAVVTMMRHLKYPNLFHDGAFNPGIYKSSEEEWVAVLIDSLIDKLTLLGEDTVSQVQGYRRDRDHERSLKAERFAKNAGGRRKRHHWDKVSALMVACAVAPKAPRRYKLVEQPKNVVLFGDMTWDQHLEYEKKLASFRDKRAPRRIHGRRR